MNPIRAPSSDHREKSLITSPTFREVLSRGRRPSSRGGARALILALSLAAGCFLILRPAGRLVEGDVTVIDGDSLRIRDTEIRLAGVDAPEYHQTCSRSGRSYPCGRVARDALVGIVAHQTIACRITGRDRYGRSLASCRVGEADLGATLVERGLAVAYGGYVREEAVARAQSLGLWAGEFELPSEWRRRRAGEPAM